MAAGERARKREERERETAALAEQRAAERERARRKAARQQQLFGWIPKPRPGQSGTRAARKRRDGGLVLAIVFAVNLLVWLASDGWALRSLALLLSLLATPIVLNLVERK